MKKFLLFFGIIVLFACNEKPVKNEPKDNIDTPEQNSSEEKVVIETVKNFLYWYRDNYDKVNSYNIVPQSGDTIEDQYRIDYKEVDKYLDALNKSGYIATEFILKEKIFF